MHEYLYALSRRPRHWLHTCILAFATTAMTISGLVHAESAWPDRPVRIVVPFTAGGTTDVVARVIGAELGQLWHQSVIIDNRPGAGGAIGATLTAKSPPDGYTLLMASGSMFTVNPYLYRNLPYSLKDFDYITNVASGPMLVLVNNEVPAHTLKELIALAKSQPKKLNFGSAGNGSQVHMAGEALADAAGIDITHVPYKGEALAYNDLIAGQVQLVVGNIAAASVFAKSGKARALAVTGPARSPMMPEVPTAKEAGLPGYETTGWFALVTAAGTPKAVIDKIQRDTAKVLAQPAIREKLAGQGMTPVGNTPAQLVKSIQEESGKWEAIVANRHLAID
ncbi:Bug family tripartite tricarboxylate transporter substrate binding protein [Bordetella genomosp. 9]|uniref:LacI family transcriptional regulator n=1 Tax=Bordetella genomosp. 9 TaxID=1416803 RepID=A0A1W6Z3N8_9BORD|nr:tripartite tricarboxylate transporter substrate binding protein [Bordetella genomosp. 9]ARP87443.1 LacI family transcriptional regulator [Bordetella genomosp. 9]ARP91425.1 LacI family transcriptional regulator [Bordetella genomosp. 9]